MATGRNWLPIQQTFTIFHRVGSCWFFASEKDPTPDRRLKCRNDVKNESHRKPDLPALFFAPRALNLLRRDEFIATAGKLEVKIRLECSSYFLYS